MEVKRKKYTSAYKVKVAIEAIKERETLSELSHKFEVQSQLISKWKYELLERSLAVFENAPPKEEVVDLEQLYAKIGRL